MITALDKITVGGPCKIIDPAGTIYTEDAVTLEPVPTYRDVANIITGEQDKVLVDLHWEIKFKPKSVWTAGYRAVLLPSAFYNYTTSGARMIGAGNRSIQILGADANGYTLTRGIVTQMPNLFLGLGSSLYDTVTMTGFIGHGKALTDADAFMVANTTAWDQSDYPTANQEQLCQLAWGAVTGWDTVFAEEGFKLAHELKTQDVKQGNILVDKKIIGYRGALTFKPQQPTSAQLLTALNPVIGSRRSTGANDAVIVDSGAAISVTVKSAAVEKVPYIFDNKLNRHGEIALVNALSGPGTRLTLA